jgi:hypothetical protein
MAMKYVNYGELKADEISFVLGTDRHGKPSIQMHAGPNAADVALVSPACVTNWPRVTGDGNFGTMWGPTDIAKAKFTLDLCDTQINESPNEGFAAFSALMEAVDNRLLDFVQTNQLKILGRKNLSREETKMLQIRSVRPKYDKLSGSLAGHSVQMSAGKFAWDGCGGRYPRTINVCDHTGAVVQNGTVQAGDVVAVTMFANQVYTGVGGDKFGIHWSFEDVQIVCQRARLAQKTSVPCFQSSNYTFAMPYMEQTSCMQPTVDYGAQFSEPMTV